MAKWTKEQHAKFRATLNRKAMADGKTTVETDSIPADALAYVYGRVEEIIETQARSAHVSSATLAFRLGQLLLKQARR